MSRIGNNQTSREEKKIHQTYKRRKRKKATRRIIRIGMIIEKICFESNMYLGKKYEKLFSKKKGKKYFQKFDVQMDGSN